jgi:DNA-binding NarL/FixJ family response regulator
MSTNRQNIVIAEANSIVRMRLKAILEKNVHVSNVYDTHSTSYMAWLESRDIDLAIVNQSLLQDTLARFSGKFVVSTTYPHIIDLKRVYDAGAIGYLSHKALESMLDIILCKENDAFLIEPGLAPLLMKCLADARNSSYIKDELLTPREKEIVALLRAGVKRDSIAQRLNIANATLQTHIKNIARKREPIMLASVGSMF